MGKKVILTLIQGSFEQGFPVILRIESGSATAEHEQFIQVVGKLPPAPQILELLQQWQSAYRQIVMLHSSRIKPKLSQVTNVSCRQLGSKLSENLNIWLNSGSSEWQKIRDQLQHHLSETDEIMFIIETAELRLRQLPWHLWDLFSKYYTKAEVALSAPEYQAVRSTRALLTDKVRILAILGDSTGIDVQRDREALEQLPNAQIDFLVEPQRQHLNNQLWKQQWDILFFAGHSGSGANCETGRIYINRTDSLTIDDLRYALKTAIEHGLKLVIFNSCNGLGLVQELAGLHIPQIIVMREPVPDLVAQEFLQHFLRAFASGKSLYLAVREARERLQGMEDQFPCATWLPVICQNPACVPLTWQELCWRPDDGQQNRPILPSKPSLRTVLLTSVVVTALVMGIRHLGVMQTWELQAFDQLVRQRPDEGPDPRLLVVAITEEDIRAQKHRKGSLSDPAFAQLLEKLEPYQPRAIGLDIYRDFPVDRSYPKLAALLRQNEHLIAVCKGSDSESDPSGVPPPPEIPPERLGFSDFIEDADGIIRRQLLSMTPDPASVCTTPYAFSVQLAFRYLAAEGLLPRFTSDGNLQIGPIVFKRLKAHTGSYQQVDARGNQILLNYRSSPSPEKVVAQVTLTQVLSGQLDPKFVRGRVVLIGATGTSAVDVWATPYGAGPDQQMSGVFMQAQMVSQIISAVLDQRSLLWVWPTWGEILWIWGWSLIGGMLVWQVRSSFQLGLAIAASLVCLYGICFTLLTQSSCLVPLVPSTLALIAASGSVATCKTAQGQRRQ